MGENKAFYTEQISRLSCDLQGAQRRFRIFTLLRFIFFVSAITSLWIFWLQPWMIPAFALLIAAFLWAVARSVDAKYRRDLISMQIEISRLEIRVLNGDWSSYEEGEEFKNPKHPYTHDLDIFGSKSIFQLLNRTVSEQGKIRLAQMLALGAENVEMNRAAIRSLQEKMAWNHRFLAEGLVDREDIKHDRPIRELAAIEVKNSLKIRVLRFLIPILAFAATVCVSLDLISGYLFSVIVVINLGLIGNEIRKTNKIAFSIVGFERRVKIIRKQLLLYRDLDLDDPLMKSYKERLFGETDSVIAEIDALVGIINRFNYRMNFLVGLVLNFFLAWDFHMRLEIERWMDQHKEKLRQWEEYVANLEVWISGATFRFNFPETVFTEFSEDGGIAIEGLKHPFIHPDKVVANSIRFRDKQQFLIVTGPNMAGKSTFLRAFGLAFVFSNAGFPVLAETVRIPRMKLFTSMRTTDDLHIDSSYFHAELTRLRSIVDEIEKGEPVFVILDEILKGTNSRDKEIGSARFLMKLKRLKAYGLIATHDLSLCKLADTDSAFGNIYFDSTILDDQILFDYKCRDGVCKNMNASFLLKQMDLIDEDDSDFKI